MVWPNLGVAEVGVSVSRAFEVVAVVRVGGDADFFFGGVGGVVDGVGGDRVGGVGDFGGGAGGVGAVGAAFFWC